MREALFSAKINQSPIVFLKQSSNKLYIPVLLAPKSSISILIKSEKVIHNEFLPCKIAILNGETPKLRNYSITPDSRYTNIVSPSNNGKYSANTIIHVKLKEKTHTFPKLIWKYEQKIPTLSFMG